MSYTAGPWSLKRQRIGEQYGAIVGKDGDLVATTGYRVTPLDDEDIANARLIAAAPDLLEVLRRMIDHGTRCNWFADRGDEELVRDAEEIIKKATR